MPRVPRKAGRPAAGARRSRTAGRPRTKAPAGRAEAAAGAPAGEERALRKPQHPFPVVGIGASAGGLEAFRRLLGALPADTGMAYVLVQHLDPRHESILAGLLSEATPMAVAEVKGDVRLEPNRVYVIPPSHDIGIGGGLLKLVPRSGTGGAHMPVDYFLRTLAEAQGDRGIGVILSGTASDGTLGLKSIKAEGGITFAQEPDSAKFDGMPTSAIAAGCVDFVLPPEAIARELTRLGRHPYVAPGESDARRSRAVARSREKDGDGLDRILLLLGRASGADFSAYKKTTLERRIARRMAVNRIDTLGEYARHLESNPGEIEALYQDCLISVTSFFRVPEAFEALSERVLPVLLAERSSELPLRVWVPGCATGEEVYSIAICLLERAEGLASRPGLQIFATDLSEAAIEKARAGTYPESIAQDVSLERLRRFFSKLGDRYRVAKAIREMCVFARHDLARDPPYSRMDLVSCRNVLIYMEPRLQERVIATFHYALSPWGCLMLGPSEGIDRSTTLFAPLDEKHRIYSRKATAVPPRFRLTPAAARGEPAKPAQVTPRAAARSEVPREADRLLLARYAPPGVLVDEALNVLEFRGDTHPFLEHTHGQASLNLFRMARKGLLLELRQAVQEARSKGAASRKAGLAVRYRGQLRRVTVEVTPIKGPAARERCLLVLFEEAAAVPGKAGLRRTSSARSRTADPREIERLGQKLAETVQYLHTIVQEHEAALEELQSANEEALSSNEELQSVNEELQTAKEEVQSANEELATLNQELQDRNAQLAHANETLKRRGWEIQRALDYANAIVATVREPLLILDGELRVEKANRAYYETFGVRPEQTMGRLLYELGDGHWDLPGLRRALTEALPGDGSFEDLEVEVDVPGSGPRTVALNARHLRYEDGGKERILLAIEDRTGVRRAEREREALLTLEQVARERAEAADRVKDEFVATVSHELRGPLTAMVGWMHIFKAEGSRIDAATLARGLAAIDRGVKAQSRLVADLMDHSRMVTGKFRLSRRVVNLAAVVEAGLDGVRAAADAKDIDLQFRRDPGPLMLLGDADRLQQVVWNLALNAVKFTPRGQRVQVWIGRVENQLHLRVSDTGHGIRPDLLPHVFDRFRQADTSPRSQAGLGLGLGLVRQLVELHGGTVHAESPGEDRGATFTVMLPIPAMLMEPEAEAEEVEEPASTEPSAAAEPEPEPDRTMLDGLSVLVVEDEADSREAIAAVLERYGARVMAAASAAQAIEALEAATPDVLVSDIGMPEVDGYDLIRTVRRLAQERGGGLPALALTAYVAEGERHKAVEAGFQDHLLKPVAPARLVTAVAQLAGRLG